MRVTRTIEKKRGEMLQETATLPRAAGVGLMIALTHPETPQDLQKLQQAFGGASNDNHAVRLAHL